MIYRILITLVLIVAIVAVGVALEPSSSAQVSPSTAPAADDSSMKSLRIE